LKTFEMEDLVVAVAPPPSAAEEEGGGGLKSIESFRVCSRLVFPLMALSSIGEEVEGESGR
jgi:hypothetical protein